MEANFIESIYNLSPAYFIIAAVSTVLFLIFVILTFFGIDSEGADTGGFDVDSDSEASFFVFSFKTILVGLMGLGWTGTSLVNEFAWTRTGAILPSVMVAIVLMLIMNQIFKSLFSLEKVYTFDINHAVGKEGAVYLPITVNKPGQVTLSIDGRTYTFPAISKTDDFKSHERVIITAIETERTLVVNKP